MCLMCANRVFLGALTQQNLDFSASKSVPPVFCVKSSQKRLMCKILSANFWIFLSAQSQRRRRRSHGSSKRSNFIFKKNLRSFLYFPKKQYYLVNSTARQRKSSPYWFSASMNRSKGDFCLKSVYNYLKCLQPDLESFSWKRNFVNAG